MIVWILDALIKAFWLKIRTNGLIKIVLGNLLFCQLPMGEGNFRANESILSSLEASDQILLSYSGNPNGSMNDIAGIRILHKMYGMMPHPERAVGTHHPCLDGLPVLNAFLTSFQSSPAEISS